MPNTTDEKRWVLIGRDFHRQDQARSIQQRHGLKKEHCWLGDSSGTTIYSVMEPGDRSNEELIKIMHAYYENHKGKR